jgi:hypothetical protein
MSSSDPGGDHVAAAHAANLARALHGLGDVPWDRLVGGRGGAADLPSLITAAVGGADLAARRTARGALWEAIQHQGQVFEATAHVVPFLVNGIDALADPERAAVVAMLGHLAAAHSTPQGHALETRRALWEAREPLGRLLGQGDRQLRLQVPHALVGLYSDALAAAPAWVNVERQAEELSSRLEELAAGEADATVQAGYHFALGMLAEVNPRNLTRLRRALGDPAVQRPARVASALALLGQGPEAAMCEILVAALADRGEHATWFPHPFPWLQTLLRFLITGHLCSRAYSDPSFQRALPVLADVIRQDAVLVTLDHDLLPVLARALGGRRLPEGARRQDLSPALLTVLQAVNDNRAVLDAVLSQPTPELASFGLPRDRAAWQLLMNGA